MYVRNRTVEKITETGALDSADVSTKCSRFSMPLSTAHTREVVYQTTLFLQENCAVMYSITLSNFYVCKIPDFSQRTIFNIL